VFTKGAPDVLLTRCTRELVGDDRRPLTDERRARILEANEVLASQALRTLGVAGRWLTDDLLEEHSTHPDERLEHDLTFAGLIGIIDPPRPEAKNAVERARRAGIRPVMITGDHPRTAAVIAQELGITTDGRALTGSELERLAPDALARGVTETSVYARVNPEHRLRIIDALRRSGAVVAMTGDGVDDAPALKKADIGVAMGITGTDVSKEAADMVLADDNFASIVAAVEEGRAVFANIRKFLRYLLSSNTGEVMTMFFGVLLARQIGLDVGGDAVVLPLLATQILWINMVTDGPPALALGVDPADDGLWISLRDHQESGSSPQACGAASCSLESSWRSARSSCSTPPCQAASWRAAVIFATRRRWPLPRRRRFKCSMCSTPGPMTKAPSLTPFGISGCGLLSPARLPCRCWSCTFRFCRTRSGRHRSTLPIGFFVSPSPAPCCGFKKAARCGPGGTEGTPK
jgi:magnesium-transporting ATPase (P-type)